MTNQSVAAKIAGTIGMEAPAAIIAEIPAYSAAKRLYRPELDALRFFAFSAVLLNHGPVGGHLLWYVRSVGGFGLSMFFLLSAYLITELLVREREQTGMIAWRLFLYAALYEYGRSVMPRLWLPLLSVEYRRTTSGFLEPRLPPWHYLWPTGRNSRLG
jgi:hypothetical protein